MPSTFNRLHRTYDLLLTNSKLFDAIFLFSDTIQRFFSALKIHSRFKPSLEFYTSGMEITSTPNAKKTESHFCRQSGLEVRMRRQCGLGFSSCQRGPRCSASEAARFLPKPMQQRQAVEETDRSPPLLPGSPMSGLDHRLLPAPSAVRHSSQRVSVLKHQSNECQEIRDSAQVPVPLSSGTS